MALFHLGRIGAITVLQNCREKDVRQSGQEGNFIRGKKESDWPLRRTSPPFLDGSFLFPTKEKFSEGMVT